MTLQCGPHGALLGGEGWLHSARCRYPLQKEQTRKESGWSERVGPSWPNSVS